MDIIIRVPGRVEVEDMGHALDIQPARRDVRGHQQVDRPRLESIQLPLPCRLVDIAVNLSRAETMALQALVQFAHRGLAVAKDNRGMHILAADQVAEHFALFHRRDIDKLGVDIGVRRCWPGDLDIFGVGQETVRQLLDRRRHGSGKQQSLPVGRQLGADHLDVGNEAHVEHPIGLINHQHFAAGEQYLAAFEQVHQPSWRRDQHVNTLFKGLHLIAHLYSTDQQRHGEPVVDPIFLKILGNLRGEFAGGFKDQAAWHARAGTTIGEHVDHRQHEACGLARPCLRDRDQVAHHLHLRDRRCLHRGRRVIACGSYRSQQFVGKAEIGETHKHHQIWKSKGTPAHHPHGAWRALGAAAVQCQGNWPLAQL